MIFSNDSTMQEKLDVPIVSRRDFGIGTGQVEGFFRVASSVTAILHRVGLTSFQVVVRDGPSRVGEYFGSFDDSSREAGHDMELDVAMEKPDAYTLSAFSYEMMEEGNLSGLSALNRMTA